MTAPFRKALLATLRVLLLALPTAAPAIDEAALAEQIAGKVTVGESIGLTIGGEPVLALLAEETQGDLQGGAILIHDTGAHFDWPAVIRPLREDLPDAGWTTLSLQMPLSQATNAEARVEVLDAARLRLEAALAQLDSRGIRNVVLIGHGLGALIAADYLSDYEGETIRGLVAIGITSYPGDDERLHSPTVLRQIRKPVLDIYGSRDLPVVTELAKRRAKTARKAMAERAEIKVRDSDLARTFEARNPGRVAYRQVKINGADHDFTAQQTALLRRVRGWLNRYATGVRIRLQQKETQ